jgi:hypothetical protein
MPVPASEGKFAVCAGHVARHVADDLCSLSSEENQAIAGRKAGGKSELHRAGCRVIPGEGDLEESATEKRPLLRSAMLGHGVRVKRRGKSPPRDR